MDKNIVEHKRKSYMEIGEIYFWTATINNWQHLLQKDMYKDVVINSLEHLCSSGKIDVFAFVIMPNHIHLIWRTNEHTGRKQHKAHF